MISFLTFLDTNKKNVLSLIWFDVVLRVFLHVAQYQTKSNNIKLDKPFQYGYKI
jgi:hypothetical protein